MNTMATESSYAPYPAAPSRYSFVVSRKNPGPATVPAPMGLPADAEMQSTVRLQSAHRDDVPLALVFRPRPTQGWSHQAPVQFWIHGGPGGEPLCSVQPAGPGVFDVHAADGAPLARITRRSTRLLPWPRRVRWSVTVPATPRPLTGKVGTWYSWFLYLATSLLWLPLLLILAVYTWLEDGVGLGDRLTGPTRTRWHARGFGTALDYRGLNRVYHYRPQLLDLRIAYALAVLHAWDRTD